ncbi:MAG: zinc ribbon domain-containing protein [Eubacteriaceae bacterium]
MSDSKIYTLEKNITIQMVAENVQRFLSEQKKLTAEALETNNGYLVQAKASESWKKFAGMDSSIQVQLASVGENAISINIGSAKWVDKAGAAVAGALIFWPLLATSAIGAYGQKKLPEEILNFIDRYIASGTYPSAFTFEQPVSETFENAITCPDCHTMNPESSKFCQKCGSKLGLECVSCHTSVNPNQKFCPNCGTSIPSKAPDTEKCLNCDTELLPEQKFCSKCGTPAPIKEPETPVLKCLNCQTVLDPNQKFCPGCGTTLTLLSSNEEEIKNEIEGE